MTQPKLRFQSEDGTEFPEWEEKSIKEIAPLQRGFDLPEKERVNGEYPVVCSNGIVAYHNQYKCEGYAVITGRSGTIGNFTYLDKCRYWPHNTSLWVTDFCGNNPKFIYYFYHTIRIEQYSTGTGVPTLNRNNVHASRHYVPCLEEQQKIADFLSAIDEVITQSETEVRNLEQQKKAAMQKIFSQEVRFRREDGTEYPEWEELTMDDIFTEIIEKDRADLPVLSILQGQGTVYRDSSDRNIMYDKKSTVNYKAMKKGDFIIHLRTFEGGLECATLDGISSPAYKILRTNILIPEVYKGYFRSKQFIDGRLAIAVTGVRDGKNIEMSTFWQIIVPVPSLEEQQKIADFFSAYDEAITFAKQEVDKWKELKKGLLQQMFV